MTKKLFWQDPYLSELQTTVVRVQGNQITVAETIFYAFSGGQESDEGTIADYRVIEAKKNGKEIIYTLNDGHALKAGDRVKMAIDWPRRYRLMRLHFAAEVILELVCQRFPHIIKVGAHIAADKARIDFEWGESLSPVLVLLQQAAQTIIDADQPIISAFSDEANERRYWKINEFSQVPCGGTHIKKTGEMGAISLKRKNPGKGRERIEIYVN
ncbi:MAG: alanyl-tRNA editing protein [Gammaproteobacteria bacterium]|nr:alanyl-tRNA editing protein [Gammaproteobacteria bacterium]